MAITVYNEGAGLFHAGSGGKGVAPADVCLSPPPPPAGPVPVPYVNSLSASDLAEGSTTVLVDGNPTALEDKSYVSTSTGDEGGTQGGNVVTHKTKGKGYFKVWSSTLLIQGKGACRHGDPMGQNCASSPPGCVDMEALVAFRAKFNLQNSPPCTKEYVRPKNKGRKKQKAHVRGKPCWECERGLQNATSLSFNTKKGIVVKTDTASGRADPQNMTHDHQPPISTAWENGGCHMTKKDFDAWVDDNDTVKPHCKYHSGSQGGTIQGGDAKDDMSTLIDMLEIRYGG